MRIEQDGNDVLLWIKAVPGASRDELVGRLGEGAQARLKIRVAAPPEAGKANKAIRALLADALACRRSDVTIESGFTSPEKTVRIARADADVIRRALRL